MPFHASTFSIKEKSKYFHPAQLAQLDPNRLPHHIAIIPDGNRRWAKQQMSMVEKGHQEGSDTLIEIVWAAKEIGIEAITVYGFSTENWARPEHEVIGLMAIFGNYLLKNCEQMVEEGVKLDTIGDLSKFPSFLREIIANVKEETRSGKEIRLILALNYGARDEICRAFKSMLYDYDSKRLKKEDITEQTISCYLDTNGLGDPELLIRTSGELRVSNFLLWQIYYTEIYTTPVLWPDFTPQHLLDAVLDYQNRNRRRGGD